MTQFNKLAIASTDTLPPVVVGKLSQWGLVCATGEQRTTYLQGQLTCDLIGLQESESTWGGLCDPKGKLWASFQTVTKDDALLMMMRADVLSQTLTELKKYAVFSKIELTDATDQWQLYGIAGAQAKQWLENSLELTLADHAVTQLAQGFILTLNTPTPRFILALQQDADFNIETRLSDVACDDGSFWDALDILAGAPVMTEAMSNAQIPQAFNLHALNGVSFNKGCYTGQETVARAKYRGTNKRALAILKGHSAAAVAPGEEIELQLGENWRIAGKVNLSYRYSDGIQLLTAVLAKDLEADSILRLKQNESDLRLQPLPYSLDESEQP